MLFLVVTTISGEARFACVRCPVPGPPRSESWSVPLPADPLWSAVQSGFAVVMAQVRRPVPFRTRKLRPGCGDGTALERVWESSAPPHSTVWRTFRSSPLGDSRKVLFVFPWGSRRGATLPEPPFLLCLLCFAGLPAGTLAFSDFQSAYLAPKVFCFVPLPQ